MAGCLVRKKGNKEDYGILKEINVEVDYWDEQFDGAIPQIAFARASNQTYNINSQYRRLAKDNGIKQ